MVCGTLTARILPTDRIYQVAAVVAIVAAVYMRIFLEADRRTSPLANDGLEQPMLKSTTEEERNESLKTTDLMKLPKDMYRLFKTSNTVSLASFVAFFNSLAEAGIAAFLMVLSLTLSLFRSLVVSSNQRGYVYPVQYFLKARFHFQKDQFADIWLITYAAATFSTVLLICADGVNASTWSNSRRGDTSLHRTFRRILECMYFSHFLVVFFHQVDKNLTPSVGYLLQMLLDSIAWEPWVPYASAFLGIFLFLASPSGIAQGCLMGIASLANVVSPLIFSPLSALFLSDDAPFNFPGFSILSVGLAYLIAFFISIVIKIQPHCSTNKACNHPCSLA
ncbi:hypothetical protein SASPL_118146 [Salvia splendens]|uniref:Transmembrane protein n=1 Tax=Salvia splendens TaxID=180675 RepID=A0A8X8ZZL8_SALSN|nr:hypothetical protein SASPL_118146 [Salvia splendens]